ncbi:hypothetical protein V2J09_019332 [Rumex salicifolius]
MLGKSSCRNRTAENLYGYSAAEALGKSVFELLVDSEHFDLGVKITNRVQLGECWTGFFPVNGKKERRFTIVLTNTPLYDEDGTVIGITCSAADSKSFEDMRFTLPYACNSGSNVNFNQARTSVSAKRGLDPDQPVQDAIASKITDLASKVGNKVKSKMRYGKNNVVCEVSINDNLRSNVASLRGNAASFFGTISETGELASKFIKDLGEESEGRAKITSKAEAWISKKYIHWPWKGNQQELSEAKSESKANGSSHLVVKEEPETSSSSSLFIVSSKNNVSSISTNTSCSSAMKPDMGIDCMDYEIFSEDLTYKQQIGQGSCGTVYHGLWCGSDVAIKVFPEVDYTDDAILSFRQEVSIMKGLRHPNVLLFMGAVLSPQRLSIITEFLPRLPRIRPSFEELLIKLKHLAKEYAVRVQAARSGTIN